jgi:basic membrane lipoprotein Med (substrate-binding protein (PBP1-ABC) superfamily)
MEPSIDRAIKAVTAGTFEAVDYGPYSFMAHGGASLVVDDKLVPEDVVAMVKEKEKEITDGMFRVNINDAEPKSTA